MGRQLNILPTVREVGGVLNGKMYTRLPTNEEKTMWYTMSCWIRKTREGSPADGKRIHRTDSDCRENETRHAGLLTVEAPFTTFSRNQSSLARPQTQARPSQTSRARPPQGPPASRAQRSVRPRCAPTRTQRCRSCAPTSSAEH